MTVQRKVFRIEQVDSVSAAPVAGDEPRQDEILAELKALHDLIVSQTRALPQVDTDNIDETHTVQRAISHTKQEIATLHAGTFSEGRPRATRELDAVVDGTERATQQILDAAEIIEEAANSLSASVRHEQDKALAQDIRDHVLRIFEACNFQDLSGQRIAKVMATLQFVENRIARMMEIWGGAESFKAYAAAAMAERQRHPALLHGPRLDDEPGHASQADIDALFKAG